MSKQTLATALVAGALVVPAPNLCPFRLTVADGTAVYSGTGKKKTLIGIAVEAQ